jgi:hypothetical protein
MRSRDSVACYPSVLGAFVWCVMAIDNAIQIVADVLGADRRP